jgi:hypothetical protein
LNLTAEHRTVVHIVDQRKPNTATTSAPSPLLPELHSHEPSLFNNISNLDVLSSRDTLVGSTGVPRGETTLH